MKLELLVFDGCPNREPARDMFQACAISLGLQGDIQEVMVETPDQTQALRFPGSPTLRVNGVDVAPLPEDFMPALGCRTYLVQGRRQGLPDPAWITEALRNAMGAEAHARCAPIAASTETPAGRPGPDAASGKKTVFSALLLGALASACCWLPLALSGAGIAAGTVGARFAWIRPWALAALGILFILLIGAWALKRRRHAMDREDCCAVPPRFPTFAALILILSFLGGAAAPRLLRSNQNAATETISTPAGGTLLVLATPQFDCPSCAGSLPETMTKTLGVASVHMDFTKHETQIVFQPGADLDGILTRWKQDLGFEGKEIRREAFRRMAG